ncbi:MAG: DUF4838 domain-containing protein [Kiritimatiellae bacterium]|nr:DUF4838 domain-containing protein [Kiritimatiellia bacterium]
MKTRCLAALLAVMSVGCTTDQSARKDVAGDRATFCIELPDEPKPWEKTAAEELEHYLGLCLGRNRLTVEGQKGVVFHVGDTAFAREQGLAPESFKDEEWLIKSFGRNVVLAGGGTRGTLYAVYHFLEDDCGVRWWGDNDEDVPVPKMLAFGVLDRRGKPFFECRNIYRWRSADPRTAVRNRLNDNGNSPIPLALGGAFTYGPPHLAHTWDRYLPFSEYGKAHPEWYSLWEGERIGGHGNGQLCLTCPGLTDEFARRLEDYIVKGAADAAAKGLAAPRIYDISHNDCTMKFCQCPSCTAERAKCGHTGMMLKFVNEVIDKAAKAHPDLLFSTLAYWLTEPVPSNGVVAADNVIVRLCNTKQNMATGIHDPDNKFMHDQVIAWKDCTKHLYVWEYAITYDKLKGYPFPSEFYIPENYRFYAENGVTGFLIEHEDFECSDMYELKFYLERKMLEDPFQKPEGLIEGFMTRYYGAAGGKVLEARKLLDRRRREKKAFIRFFPLMGEFNFFTNDDLAEVRRMFDVAEAAVADDQKRLARVKRAYLSFGRMADFRARFGGKHPPEQGVSDKPFFDIPADDKAVQNHDKSVIDFVKDIEVGDPLGGGDMVTRVKVTERDIEGYYRLPFDIGVYDLRAKKTLLRKRWEKPLGEGYCWHSVGRVKLPELGFYTYFTRKWTVQVPLCLPGMNGNEFEVKALVKFTGPMFFPGSKQPNEIRIARLAYVEP